MSIAICHLEIGVYEPSHQPMSIPEGVMRVRWLVLGLAAYSTGSVSGAQSRPSTQTGSLVPGHASASPIASSGQSDPDAASMQVLSNEQAVRTARKLAACTVRNAPADARAFILAHPGQGAAAIKRISHVMETCLGYTTPGHIEMRFGFPELQGFMAEAWLQKTMPQFAASGSTPDRKTAGWMASDAARAALDQTAACVVQAHPQLATALVSSAPDREGETRAFTEILPALKECIDPHSAFRANRPAVRLSLAKALFHRAYDPEAS